MLTPEEIERYKRHLLLKEIGGEGQQTLKSARVLVVGAGGLGSPCHIYLAAAGIGTNGIVDDDSVSLDNHQRQIVHAVFRDNLDGHALESFVHGARIHEGLGSGLAHSHLHGTDIAGARTKKTPRKRLEDAGATKV